MHIRRHSAHARQGDGLPAKLLKADRLAARRARRRNFAGSNRTERRRHARLDMRTLQSSRQLIAVGVDRVQDDWAKRLTEHGPCRWELYLKRERCARQHLNTTRLSHRLHHRTVRVANAAAVDSSTFNLRGRRQKDDMKRVPRRTLCCVLRRICAVEIVVDGRV